MKSRTALTTLSFLLVMGAAALEASCGSSGSTLAGGSSSASSGPGGTGPGSSSSGGASSTTGGAGAASSSASSSSASTGGASTSSSSTSASSGGDAGPDDAGDGGPTTSACGAETCRTDQTCVASHCTTPCTGTQVPGDYATVQGAVTALQHLGGTICLGPQTFTESVVISNTSALSVTGTSSLSKIEGRIEIPDASTTLTLKGFAVHDTGTQNGNDRGAVSVGDNASSGLPLTLDLIGMHIVREAQIGSGVYVFEFNSNATVLIDGCDISASKIPGGVGSQGDGAAIYVATVRIPGTFGSFTVGVQNSYLHDGQFGILADAFSTQLNLANNTILGNDTGIQINVGPQSTVATNYNSIISGSTVGVAANGATSTLTSGNNLYFGNTNNFMGLAADGPGDLKADPLLDHATTPAGLAAGSPARGAADPAHAPSVDFFNRPRPAKPDFGAVQM